MEKAFIEIALIKYLLMMKITPNLKGYSYFKEAVHEIFDANFKIGTAQNLYKRLSLIHGEKTSLIERSLRHALKVSVSRNGIKDFEKSIDVEFANERPSPKEIICVLAQKISIELKRYICSRS